MKSKQDFALDDPQADVADEGLLENCLRPLCDAEVDRLEELCRAATPGQLVFEEEAGCDGALVATLPDGSNIVACEAPFGLALDQDTLYANGQLFCQARRLLLRLLAERRQWRLESARLCQQLADVQAKSESPRPAETLPLGPTARSATHHPR